MIRLEARPEASKFWTYASPVLALLVTVTIGVLIFLALGKDPVKGLQVFFWEPIKSPYALGELMVKATPLLIIALGLAVCFRSNVWNIGAEGQFVMGAVAAGGVALLADKTTGSWIVVAIVLAGVLGGMVWAGITALLRDRFNANEILVSLMLVYVADMVLSYLVFGPWKDPAGYNFPQTRTFDAVTQIPRLMAGSRVNIGIVLAAIGVLALWLFLFRTFAGFRQEVGGLAPAAARYAGKNASPVIEVAIGANGQLLRAVIRRSSGDPELDQAALAILKLASPFDPFPPELARRYRVLRFVYEWQFVGGRVAAGTVTAAP